MKKGGQSVDVYNLFSLFMRDGESLGVLFAIVCFFFEFLLLFESELLGMARFLLTLSMSIGSSKFSTLEFINTGGIKRACGMAFASREPLSDEIWSTVTQSCGEEGLHTSSLFRNCSKFSNCWAGIEMDLGIEFALSEARISGRVTFLGLVGEGGRGGIGILSPPSKVPEAEAPCMFRTH